jgi:ABC-2 type transport system permease protein
MVSLLAAPVKRRAVAFTQMKVLATGIIILVALATVLEILLAIINFPGELDIGKLLLMNVGLLCLHLFIGGVCFFCSCLFSEAKYSLGFGAGIPFTMFVIQMLGNVGGGTENAKYFTFFSLYDYEGLKAGGSTPVIGIIVLFAGALILFSGAIMVFSRKDLHI